MGNNVGCCSATDRRESGVNILAYHPMPAGNLTMSERWLRETEEHRRGIAAAVAQFRAAFPHIELLGVQPIVGSGSLEFGRHQEDCVSLAQQVAQQVQQPPRPPAFP